MNQKTFLSKEGNEALLFSLLSQYLKSDRQIVHNSTGDADTMISAGALEIATEGKEVNIVVAGDTDVQIMLMH